MTGTHAAIDAVWRIEAPRIIGGLTRILRDLDAAEDAAHDALVAALEQWPSAGIPANPGAWLMAAAKNRAIDRLRRHAVLTRKLPELGIEIRAKEQAPPDHDAALDNDLGDDVLRLMFAASHPVLAREARAALTLRLVGGLTTAEIARAFLAPEPTIAQRIVRAKKAIAKAGVRFEIPRGAERRARIESVLEVLYLIFNEGYAATSGDDWVRGSLCEEALRLGRVLAGLAPDEAEVHGLVALMELQASRLRARLGPGGEPVLLLDQDRGRWDHLQIGRGVAALARAEHLAASPGPYTLQAAIGACHARAATANQTDWRRIADLYTALASATPSPVIELNRAVAVGMAYGPEEGLRLVEALDDAPALQGYPYLPAVRADLLERLGRHDEARADYERAASLTENTRERDVLMGKARRTPGAPPAAACS